MYEKGLIHKYQLGENKEATEIFLNMVEKHPKNKMVNYAEIELDAMGVEYVKDKHQKETIAVNGYEINSYPNPFNPTTTISYQIPNDGFVNLVVYNTLGQVVAELVNGYQTKGKYSVQFNASSFSSGVYFYKIESGSFTKVNKMLLLR